MRLTLYTQEGATRIHIEALVAANGDFQMAGHDMGEAPRKWFDHGDYEWFSWP